MALRRLWWLIVVSCGLTSMLALLFTRLVARAESAGVVHGLILNGNHATFNTDRMVVELEGGSIVRLFDRQSGTDYIYPPIGPATPDVSTGLVYAMPGITEAKEQSGVVGPTVTQKGTAVLRPTLRGLDDLRLKKQTKVNERSVEYEFSSADGDASLTMRYGLEDSSGDLLIDQRGSGKKRGLSGIRLGLSSVICNGDLLLPALGGIKASPSTARYQFENSSWQWPTGWMLPLVIFKSPSGGFWIHTQDARHHFKSVKFADQGKGAWGIAVETENAAPFEQHDSIESVTWRLNVFSGDWTVPVDQYKRWAYQANKITEKDKLRPKWVDDIRLVIKHADYIPDDQMIAYLDQLRQHVDPSKTLLFNTNWIDPSQGLIMPHWIASERGSRFNREARKRGFRTMFFANYIGITPNHPRFAEFKPHVIKNSWTGELEGWNLKNEWSAESPVQLYYVSPAYKPWRDFQISQFKSLLQSNPADGLFIDQAFLIFNDGNGLIDSQTTVDGNLAYHRELTEAIPDVAIGGESINEITMQYESFWEHHPLSLHIETDSQGKSMGWKIEPTAFARMTPLLPRFTLPHSRPIGYLAFPETSHRFYTGWRDALQVYGGIPTITRPTLAELEDPNSEVRRVMRLCMQRNDSLH